MATIRNGFGKEIDFDAAVNLMDDRIREELAADISPCSEQYFFDQYCIAHQMSYIAPFELAKENPVY